MADQDNKTEVEKKVSNLLKKASEPNKSVSDINSLRDSLEQIRGQVGALGLDNLISKIEEAIQNLEAKIKEAAEKEAIARAQSAVKLTIKDTNIKLNRLNTVFDKIKNNTEQNLKEIDDEEIIKKINKVLLQDKDPSDKELSDLHDEISNLPEKDKERIFKKVKNLEENEKDIIKHRDLVEKIEKEFKTNIIKSGGDINSKECKETLQRFQKNLNDNKILHDKIKNNHAVKAVKEHSPNNKQAFIDAMKLNKMKSREQNFNPDKSSYQTKKPSIGR